ncbi:MAG: hypothetical protein INF85_19360 [Roseomonas sp.]|nr:hypothetical protein [Roseomonas sp.]
MGVIIVTAESKHAPWLMFEAGAISKKVSEASVCPILFGLKIADLDGPLSQFQSVNFSKDDIERVVSTMNDKLADARLDPSVLKTVFEKFWPDLETKIEAVITAKRETRGLPKGREDRELLEEMLSLLRDLSRGPGIRSLRRADSDYDDLGHSSTIIGLMLESLNLIETMMRSRYFREQWGSVDLMLSFMKRLLSDPRIRGRLGSKQSEEVIAKIGFIERYVEREEVIYRNSLANALINSPKEELGQRNE